MCILTMEGDKTKIKKEVDVKIIKQKMKLEEEKL